MISSPPPAPAATTDSDATFNRAYLLGITLAATMGGLMFGYDWVVIGGAELFYEKFFKLAGAWQIGWAMSSALVGALFGAMFAGFLFLFYRLPETRGKSLEQIERELID